MPGVKQSCQLEHALRCIVKNNENLFQWQPLHLYTLELKYQDKG